MMRVRWGKVLLAFLVIWILILIYLLVPLWPANKLEFEADKLAKKLKDANEEIIRLSQENSQLRATIKKNEDTDRSNINVIEDPLVKELDHLPGRTVLMLKFIKVPLKVLEIYERV